jgi:hypothetical protein
LNHAFEDFIQMRKCAPVPGLLVENSIRIIRIEESLYQELLNSSGLIGWVGQVYQKGFDIIREEGRLIHFRREKWLRSPFGAVLDQSVKAWIESVSLKEGDLFCRKGEGLLFRIGERCCIALQPDYVANLKRELSSSPPRCEVLLSWIRLLTGETLKWGNLKGMGGTLTLLEEQLPDAFLDGSVKKNLWTSHALGMVAKLVESVIDENLKTFEDAWDTLLGLGPGLTPASDDFLVGFLAPHKLLVSSFSEKLDSCTLKDRLGEKAKHKTGLIASELLTCALEGMFSEIIYLIFENFLLNRWQDELLRTRQSPNEKIEYLVDWGHTSGTDTLAGIIFGLWSIMKSKGSRFLIA